MVKIISKGWRNRSCREKNTQAFWGTPNSCRPPTAGCWLVVAGIVLALVNQHALAQSESAVQRLTQRLTERIAFDIDTFNILGDNPLGDAAAQAILKPYLGQARGINDIEDAADALEKALSDAGHSFYRVTFPPQELSDGSIDLLFKRYKIGALYVMGHKFYSADNIKASLPALAPGDSPSTKQIAKALRIANQNPSKQVRVSLASGSSADEVDANIAVVDVKPHSISAWLNNTGTDISGDYRVGASVAHNNLFDRDHQASLTFITSPEGVDDVQQLAANYRIPFYALGGNLSLTAVQSDIDSGTVAGVFDVAGRGEVYSAAYVHDLNSIGRYHHALSLQLSDKLFDNDVRFFNQPVLEDVRSRPLTLNYQASWNNGQGSEWSGFASYSDNQSGGSFNSTDFYSLARPGASADWSKIELGAGYRRSARNWLYVAGLKLATTSDRLITGEQFSVGGTTSLRGLNERELRADEGYLINLQAWAPPLTETLRAVLFLDYAKLENNRPRGVEFESESAASLGLMFNWNPSSNISASASYGYLLDGIDQPTDPSTASEDGDGKLHFNLSYRF